MSKVDLSEAEINEFKEIFNLMDRDKGGTLGIEEIKALMDLLGLRFRPEELENILKEIDTDGSGEVDFDEFLQVMVKPHDLPYNKRDVLRAFSVFQRPEDPEGHIHADTLEQALITYCSDKNPPDDIIRLVNGLEVGPDGLFDYQARVNMFLTR